MIKRQHPQQPNLNYKSVPSIDEYSNKVKELGGKIVLPKTEITDYGFFAVCIDTAQLSWLFICYYYGVQKAIAHYLLMARYGNGAIAGHAGLLSLNVCNYII